MQQHAAAHRYGRLPVAVSKNTAVSDCIGKQQLFPDGKSASYPVTVLLAAEKIRLVNWWC
jgi:hypothetical protein